MEIKSAEFVISSPSVEKCPESELLEFAFIGRSNVGKSSLINSLTNRHGLAKTSSTPGKTQLINHFLVNKNWHIVDLPGYGYAKVSKKQRKQFGAMIRKYLTQRKNLALLFVLIDSRHTPQDVDLEFIRNLGTWQVPFVLVFTKTDKSKQREVAQNIKQFKERMLEEWEELPPIFQSSSVKGTGKKKILEFIDSVMVDIKDSQA